MTVCKEQELKGALKLELTYF